METSSDKLPMRVSNLQNMSKNTLGTLSDNRVHKLKDQSFCQNLAPGRRLGETVIWSGRVHLTDIQQQPPRFTQQSSVGVETHWPHLVKIRRGNSVPGLYGCGLHKETGGLRAPMWTGRVQLDITRSKLERLANDLLTMTLYHCRYPGEDDEWIAGLALRKALDTGAPILSVVGTRRIRHLYCNYPL